MMIEYTASDKLVNLISRDYNLLHVLSRFGIPLGFGDKTIDEICNDNGVDCTTFLAVMNFMHANRNNPDEITKLSLPSLLHYLKQSHIYFLEFFLPAIRRKLLEAITLRDSDVSFLIIKLFDEYVEGVREHMLEEEQSLFLLHNDKDNQDRKHEVISATNKHHAKVGVKLKELKNIILKYCPAQANANLLNAALYDIYRCEDEITTHCQIEDHLLMPALINNKN